MRFCILVDLRQATPLYYVMPEWWIQNDIFETHAAYPPRRAAVRR
ncbi:MAG: hypothetical protein WKF47_13550 [Geodermatophilaceae bacterium]